MISPLLYCSDDDPVLHHAGLTAEVEVVHKHFTARGGGSVHCCAFNKHHKTSRLWYSRGELDAVDARVVVANYPMASEALDIPHLDTILCLTPMVGFIEQVVGRIVRIADNKRVPLVVDVVDNVGLFAGMARTRNRWYKTVKVADVSDYNVDCHSLHEEVKPSVVISDWLKLHDPWNK
jgi:superfamily II DNA or RNA helicase